MSTLRVRAYNVRFGDALLVSVPERTGDGAEEVRQLLIDVGNVLVGEGGADEVFGPVLEDVQAELAGRPLDLYVLTHEHMDHAQGLPYASEGLGIELAVRHAWLPASAAEDYYQRFPDAEKRRVTFDAIVRYFEAAPGRRTAGIDALLANNDYRSTDRCVDYLRKMAETTTYVFRGCDLSEASPFTEAQVEVWAPEEDATVYYGRFQPMALGVAEAEGEAPSLRTPLPPPGVDAGTFYRLVESRRRSSIDNLLQIDKANNNTSVVFSLEWRGWRLLFPGDAEQRSWREMDKREVLRPVHFMKVGHHGSWNGTPPPELLDKVLPETPPDERARMAVVSTHRDTYNDVPEEETLEAIGARAEVRRIGEDAAPSFVDLEFPDAGTEGG
jgi:beta-lactamase superfamily II metal-dependent hydrolase